MSELFLRGVEVEDRVVDLLVADGTIVAIGPDASPSSRSEVIDGRGGALLPGFHDHHLHLLATAAARASVSAGPPDVRDREELAAALHAADVVLPPGGWLRATGYHESVAGELDRHDLDAVVRTRPVRVQHRGGARWVLNSAAIAALALGGQDHPSIERDAAGRPTGCVHRGDQLLRSLLPDDGPPDLAPVGAELARAGVTGVTDATPYEHLTDLDALAAAVATGALPQQVVVTGGVALAREPAPAGLTWGPVKVVIDDGDYPPPDELAAQIATAHAAGRPVAVHCVTRAALALAVAAWDGAGSIAGDRVEHGAVVPPDLRARVTHLGLTVVTQPAFVQERGDEYLVDVDGDDLPHLYPCRSLVDAGVPVAGSSDAPYATTDPWAAIRVATDRRTRAGHTLGAGEVVEPLRALQLYLGSAHDPGGPPRRVEVGEPADLCLLDAPLAEVLGDPSAERVVGTWCRGRRAH